MLELLDVRTLSFISSIISLILCVCMFYVARTRKIYDGFMHWTIGSVLFIYALALLSMRGISPDLISVVVANTLIVAGNAFIAYGLEVFTDSARRIWLFVTLGILTVLSFLYFTYVNPDTKIRIIVISTVLLVLYTYSAYIIYRYVPRLILARNRFLETVFGGQALWLIVRIFHSFFSRSPVVDFMQPSTFHSLTMLIFFCGNILIVMGLILLNFQRVEYDLSTAMAEIKTLRGFIPICSSCKKIRDDQGAWSQVEIYIRNHSDAEFSHGICPECMAKLYPDHVIDES